MKLVIKTSTGLKFNLDLKRRVTIVQGDSGTGKTLLYKTISDSLQYKDYEIISDLPVNILGETVNLSKELLKGFSGSILVIDERCKNTKLKDVITDEVFKNNALKYNVWYIICSRETHTNLYHSPKEIYRLDFDKTLNEYKLKEVYDFKNVNSKKYKTIKTEDSASGLEFYKTLNIDSHHIKGGSSGTIPEMEQGLLDKKLVMIDLANFTDRFYLIYSEAMKGNLDLCNRESFEEQLLKSSMFKHPDLEDVEDYIDSKVNIVNYKTWENFYEKKIEMLLQEILDDRSYVYKKKWDDFPKCLKDKCCQCERVEVCRYSRSDIEDKLKDILINNNLNYLLDSDKDYKNINQNLKTINF